MDELDVLARDFGFRPAGKSAPMRSDAGDRRSSSVRSTTSSPLFDDPDGTLFNDVFGGPPKYTNTSGNSNKSASMNDFNYDSIFKSGNESKSNNNNDDNMKTSSLPVYDKPVYDEDIFDGLPGVKSKSVSSSTARFEDDVFATMTLPPQRTDNKSHFDDLLGNLGRKEKVAEPKSGKSSGSTEFDDLLAGFGSGSPATSSRSFTESTQPSKPAGNSNRSSSVFDDPFVVLESTSVPANSSPGEFSDPLEEIGKLGKSGTAKTDASSVSGGVFDDLDPLNVFNNPVHPLSPEKKTGGKDRSPSKAGPGRSDAHTSTSRENIGTSSFRSSESHSQKKVRGDQESPLFGMPSEDPLRSFSEAAPPPYADNDLQESNFQVDTSPRSEEQVQSSDDIWLTVSEIPFFTQPTSAPPPSRPPPPIPQRSSKSEASFVASNARRKGDGYSSSPNHNQYSQSPKPVRPAVKSPPVSQLDELEDFARGWPRSNSDENADALSGEEMNANSVAAASAAAMKEAMDSAEAKFRHAKEVREREYAKSAKSKEAVHLERDEQAINEVQEREFQENQERLENERRQREKEEEERAQRKLERERERARELEKERARQAVERATREARERAAVGARDRAAAEARLKAERAAVEKAAAEARGRAERAAVQRAQAEARERAAVEAKERAEKAAAEAREKEAREKASAVKAEAEARRRAERAAVERAAAEARERAAVEARERVAAAARMNQQRNDNDLESFFSMGRASSAPKTRASTPDNVFDSQFQTKAGSEGPKSTSGVASSNMRKASSTTSFVDDLSSIFGASASSGDFQDVEGETEERRRARLERHQRTQERAAKALAEKNQRDLQVLRDQEERHRIAETLDFEIKRWAAGKEGNLRALLSTLQYVLWPECGWQSVSLTDLITGASVKKVYRKATLCIHPDKVQQKGANLQQKYIAEKVFDLLKEAWNKFNSEELF
ncbi:auxilin-related protein 1-like isoform X1 [Nicotiana tabacum]|uniref:Auxilin-related protein 2-like n=2 Tax=Nicotiana TaxID=4085 RepID=A0A1S4CCH2_TOBAC|nr:PREDICTED: auxilin-related protein 2-like [Nicotiana sylvestris]XP_009799252.1 PREDICTED: auxilin-related protein 2-like [Nicotiana sylvestris]XP_009799253.1 PREDICTED: auxilin-related protein 2-like [Nicotiana sylvestris]XP_016498654.1 PREDICTED: auxilin-related protein 2-like [Nicotiana tabacum]XP_016498656.1 PREDICTED: auxilin-related protein 2-like [Nicotiana tabacum]